MRRGGGLIAPPTHAPFHTHTHTHKQEMQWLRDRRSKMRGDGRVGRRRGWAGPGRARGGGRAGREPMGPRGFVERTAYYQRLACLSLPPSANVPPPADHFGHGVQG